MKNKCLCISLIISFICGCSLLQPEKDTGVLEVRVNTPGGTAAVLEKELIRLTDLQCILHKDSILVRDKMFSESGGKFLVSIPKLTPHPDYSLKLIGYKDSDAVQAVGSVDHISIQAGETTEIEVDLSYFITSLVRPSDGESVPEETVTLVWNSRQYATEYVLNYSTRSSFDYNSVLVYGITDTVYRLSPGNRSKWYYWKISCRDEKGHYGAYTDVRSFYLE